MRCCVRRPLQTVQHSLAAARARGASSDCVPEGCVPKGTCVPPGKPADGGCTVFSDSLAESMGHGSVHGLRHTSSAGLRHEL